MLPTLLLALLAGHGVDRDRGVAIAAAEAFHAGDEEASALARDGGPGIAPHAPAERGELEIAGVEVEEEGIVRVGDGGGDGLGDEGACDDEGGEEKGEGRHFWV